MSVCIRCIACKLIFCVKCITCKWLWVNPFWLAQVYWCARGTEKNERSRDTLMILQSEEVEERREGWRRCRGFQSGREWRLWKRGSFGCGSVQAGRFALAAKCGSVLLGLQSRSCSNVGRILEWRKSRCLKKNEVPLAKCPPGWQNTTWA
jgi:hypothetical protein